MPHKTYMAQSAPPAQWYNCERSELSSLFNGTDFFYIYIYIYICIFQAVRRAVNVLNVSTCI